MKVDFSKNLGPIKRMHAINQPPLAGDNCKAFRFLKEAGIPYSRLHDMGLERLWPRIDIECVFPNMDADETDPKNYRFPHSDFAIVNLMENGCEPYYNLSPTIENAVGVGYEPLYIHPPKDYQKWARICEHIIAHYNEGWANGYHLGIKYWEIWNEPDFGDPSCNFPNQQWTGTAEQYFELYDVAAKHLKARFGDSIMVGGYGAVGPYAILDDPEKYGIPKELYRKVTPENVYRFEFIEKFLAYIEKSGAPLDFFSWHSYDNIDRTWYKSLYMREQLDKHGFTDCEMHLNEWSNVHNDEHGSAMAAAKAAAMLIRMQDSPNDMLMFYDARIGRGIYAGMFNSITRHPHLLYYSFKAFNELFKLGTQVECTVDKSDIYALAATDSKKQAILMTNLGEFTVLRDFPEGYDIYLIDHINKLEPAGVTTDVFRIKQYQTVLLIRE